MSTMRRGGLTLLFSLTLFTSASLVFVVEPMFGKMALPLLGGTPAVWNTCMVFYQAVLLAGYAYAHLLSTRLRLERQIGIHAALLLLGTLALPVSIPPRLDTAGGSLADSVAADGAAHRRRWPAVRAVGHRSPAAEVVFAHRQPRCTRPLLSLRGQQCRQHSRAHRLSADHRAFDLAARAVDTVERGLRPADTAHCSLRCGGPAAEQAGRRRSTPCSSAIRRYRGAVARGGWRCRSCPPA